MSTRKDGPHSERPGVGDAQCYSAHTLIDQLRVNKERFSIHDPQIRKFRGFSDVYVSYRISVSITITSRNRNVCYVRRQ